MNWRRRGLGVLRSASCGGALAALRRAACSACARARVAFQSSISLTLHRPIDLRPELPDAGVGVVEEILFALVLIALGAVPLELAPDAWIWWLRSPARAPVFSELRTDSLEQHRPAAGCAEHRDEILDHGRVLGDVASFHLVNLK